MHFFTDLCCMCSRECQEWHKRLRIEVEMRERQVQAVKAYGSEDNYKTQQAMVSELSSA
jgi:hypothetical protein